ncbi:hypothetical protein BA190_32895 [Labrys sp. WJW]|nr:hypothetical protein BA190_32895 [Labrys sp. WJW]
MVPDHRHDTTGPLYQKTFVSYFDGQLIVSTGENEFPEPKIVATPLRRGLTVAVALCGRMSCKIDDRSVVEIAGPNATLILNNCEHKREQVFAANVRLRYAIVHIAPALIEEKFNLDFSHLMDAGKRIGREVDPVFLALPADDVVRSVASKIMACPITGLGRNIYLVGKALELVALVLDQFLPCSVEERMHLPLKDVERVQKVREMLIESYRDPPSLPVLAQLVGSNTRKLNIDFRRVFGTTVHAFLQEHRLQRAYQKVTETDLNVSEIAYSVGYQPAHFATIFRKRFGLPPTELR